MCGGLFALSRPCVFFKIECFAAAASATALAGLILTRCPPLKRAAGSLNLVAVWLVRALLLPYLANIFTEGI